MQTPQKKTETGWEVKRGKSQKKEKKILKEIEKI